MENVRIEHRSHGPTGEFLLATISDRRDGAHVFTLVLDDRIAPSTHVKDYLQTRNSKQNDDGDKVVVVEWLEQLTMVLARMTTSLPSHEYNTHDEAQAYRVILHEAASTSDPSFGPMCTDALFTRLLLRRKKVIQDLDDLVCSCKHDLSGKTMRQLIHHGACSKPEVAVKALQHARSDHCFGADDLKDYVNCLLDHWESQRWDKAPLSVSAMCMADKQLYSTTLLLLFRGAPYTPSILSSFSKHVNHASNIECLLKLLQDGESVPCVQDPDLLVNASDSDVYTVAQNLGSNCLWAFEAYGFGDTLENKRFLNAVLQAYTHGAQFHRQEGELDVLEFLTDNLRRKKRQTLLDDMLIEACLLGAKVCVVRLLTDRGARVDQQNRPRCFRLIDLCASSKGLGGRVIEKIGQIIHNGDSVLLAVILDASKKSDKKNVMDHLLSLEQVPCERLCTIKSLFELDPLIDYSCTTYFSIRNAIDAYTQRKKEEEKDKVIRPYSSLSSSTTTLLPPHLTKDDVVKDHSSLCVCQ